MMKRAPRHEVRAFTLIELLVVMGLIAILGAMTALSYRAIAKDAKLSSGKNTVMAVLDNARGLAMKTNRLVMVVFRPRMDGPQRMYVEAVLCKWSGETYSSTSIGTTDRFIPISDVPARALPSGIKVAGPRYGEFTQLNLVPGFDRSWATQVQLTAIRQSDGSGEQSGEMLAVMYAPDGTVITHNSSSDSNAAYVDFNGDHSQRFRNNNLAVGNVLDCDFVSSFPPAGNPSYQQKFEDDEPNVNIAPFVAVYDDDKARENRATDWVSLTDIQNELTGNPNSAEPGGYINQYADRIHFNRYTGVAMK